MTKTETKTSRRQDERAARIEADLLSHEAQSSPRPVEIKRRKYGVFGDYGLAQLVLEVGMVGDEGTLSAAFGRVHIQVFIGPRGGINTAYAGSPLYLRSCNGSLKDFPV